MANPQKTKDKTGKKINENVPFILIHFDKVL